MATERGFIALRINTAESLIKAALRARLKAHSKVSKTLKVLSEYQKKKKTKF